MFLGYILDAKMECFGKQRQAFRILRVAKHEFSVSHEIYGKLLQKEIQQKIKHRSRKRSDNVFFEIVAVCRS